MLAIVTIALWLFALGTPAHAAAPLAVPGQIIIPPSGQTLTQGNAAPVRCEAAAQYEKACGICVDPAGRKCQVVVNCVHYVSSDRTHRACGDLCQLCGCNGSCAE
jgi:hypothetical protein